jgi:hypothetical protein
MQVRKLLAQAASRLPGRVLGHREIKGKENGAPKQWRPRTPAMAAGLTDHVWTLREVFLYRVPPWPQPREL